MPMRLPRPRPQGGPVSRVRERNFHYAGKHLEVGGGVAVYPYQIAAGVSVRYWKCLFAPSLRIHVGPFKLWFYGRLLLRKEAP